MTDAELKELAKTTPFRFDDLVGVRLWLRGLLPEEPRRVAAGVLLIADTAIRMDIAPADVVWHLDSLSRIGRTTRG